MLMTSPRIEQVRGEENYKLATIWRIQLLNKQAEQTQSNTLENSDRKQLRHLMVIVNFFVRLLGIKRSRRFK